MNTTLPIGYDPKCSLYKREQTKGNAKWYISYYLPNKKRVQRPIATKQKEARRLLRVKELQLISGQFDEADLKKLGGQYAQSASYASDERLTIDRALEIYFEVTAPIKRVRTVYGEKYVLAKHFNFFKSLGRHYLDEISALDIFSYIRHKDELNYAEATIQSTVAEIKKVFNCLIEEAQVYFGVSPVPKKIKVPKKSGLVRDRLATEEEIQKILSMESPFSGKCKHIVPLKEILSFLVYTGARLGEVLHAEWDDFDLENGIWSIRKKPKCPTYDCLGWVPKCYRERTVILFPEALEILKNLPKVKSVGKVIQRDESSQIIGFTEYPANFIFAKMETENPTTREI